MIPFLWFTICLLNLLQQLKYPFHEHQLLPPQSTGVPAKRAICDKIWTTNISKPCMLCSRSDFCKSQKKVASAQTTFGSLGPKPTITQYTNHNPLREPYLPALTVRTISINDFMAHESNQPLANKTAFHISSLTEKRKWKIWVKSELWDKYYLN